MTSIPACPAGAPKPIRPGDPVISIPLLKLGFESPQPRFLTGSATMFTLHFVDDSHLLLTFNTHGGLIPRVADGALQSEDRLVNALLLELPSGKILARTQWHTRDRLQYLWPLSHGMFLLRIQQHLTVIDPLGNLAAGDPFKQSNFLQMDRRIGYISVSPGGDLLVVETIPPPRPDLEDPIALLSNQSQSQNNSQPQLQVRSPAPDPNAPSAAGSTASPTALTLQAPDTTIQVHMFRMVFEPQPDGPTHLIAQSAGQLSARSLIRVPATAEGFLDMTKESSQTWLFDFQEHTGKRMELSPFDTTCAPSPSFITRSEFVAFGCHGSDTKVELSGFNLRGEEPWVDVLGGQHISPFITSAPDAGRFAFSRILLTGTYFDLLNLLPEEISAQEILVFQSHDGRVLLKVQASPIQRTGQNFDLSPNGLSFAVIRAGNLDIFHLPALTKRDEEQLKLAAAAVPEKNDARIRLTPTRTAQTTAQTASQTAAQTAAQTVAQTASPTVPHCIPASAAVARWEIPWTLSLKPISTAVPPSTSW